MAILSMRWFRVCLWCAGWSSLGLPVVLAATCLQDGIPPDQRQNITFDGVSMPVGIAVGGWDSVELVSGIYEILVSEVLGYHVRTQAVSSSLNMLVAVSGCSGQDLALCTWPPTEHVTLEVWQTIVQGPGWQAFSQLLGEAGPYVLGTIGYEGYDGLHVLGRANRKSQEAAGLHLTFYGNYNSSWFQPENYAAKISDVDLNKLRNCSIADEGFPAAARLYLEATGDIDGVVERNGQTGYKCWLDQKWWLAPACRADPANCMSIVTAGKGWGFVDITQKANFFNMNVGMAVASDNENWVAINTELQSLLYAWSPDSNFVAYEQLAVQFPERHEAEFLQGIYRSMLARSTLYNFVAPGFEAAASRALGLAQNFKLGPKDIEALLIQLVTADTKDSWQTACEWVKSNNETWEVWVPDKTTCAVGKGLVDLQDNFVASKSEAVDCKMCSPGRVSVKFENTQVCSPCASGSFQNAFGASECKPCETGTMAANSGSRECDKCSLGLYANDTGMSFCYQCGAEIGDDAELWTTNEFVDGKIIELQGAKSISKCFCKEGWFLWQGRCQQCGDGLDCPGMNRLTLKRGYFSKSHMPSDVFRCLHAEYCPGGPSGTCAAGRNNQSIACNDCEDGMRDSVNGTCEECGGGDYAFFIIVCLIIPIGVTCLYIGLQKETRGQSGSSSLMVVCSLQLLLVTVQMLSVIRRFDINWREPFASVLVFLEFLSFDLEMLSVSCVTTMGPVALYGLRSLVIPVMMFAILVVHLCFLLCTRSKTFQGSNLLRTMGTTFLVFFIILFSMLLAPFQCYGHPNGTSTVKRYATVYCDGEGQHLEMFIIGGFACLMPVLFVAICTWVVMVQLPARLARSDARFLESCSFLIRRFRPGAEIASVLFLLRNALVVLCPLATSTPGQLAMMNLIFYVNFFGVAFFKPWRVMVCNLLDCMMLFGMMVILDVGSVSVTNSSPIAGIIMVMVFVVIMLLSILLTLLNGGYQYFQQKYRKRFRFFTCHQKNAAGSMARFLKMELELRNPGTKTFIDCDDLTDLTRLFSYVGQDPRG